MSPESIHRHQAMYRRLVAVTPEAHRSRHGEEQVVLFGDLLRNGENPLRLWLRAFPDLITVIRQTGALLPDRTARIALGIASLGPIGLGMFLGWISIDEYGDVPILFSDHGDGPCVAGCIHVALAESCTRPLGEEREDGLRSRRGGRPHRRIDRRVGLERPARHDDRRCCDRGSSRPRIGRRPALTGVPSPSP